MTLRLVNEYSVVGNDDLDSVMETLDDTRIGLHKVSLTNYGNTSAPAIAAGSVIEVNGALYIADTDESIDGAPADGNVYVKIVPDGDEATAEYTTTAPTWDDEKQGYYSPSAGEENERYAEFFLVKVSSAYTKYDYPPFYGAENLKITKDVDISGATKISGDVYLKGDSYNIRHSNFSKSASRSSSGTTTGTSFDIKRPVSGWLNRTLTGTISGTQDRKVSLQIYSEGTWRDYLWYRQEYNISGTLTDSSGNLVSDLGISLNPGQYRLYLNMDSSYGEVGLELNIDSCYGIPESETVVEADIWS